jgi:serine/threonine-protein kinase
MGVVWRARHRVLNVIRAVKTLPAESDGDPERAMRFCVEGEAAARLDHPHIVRVHEFGQHDGRLYFTMEYLEGGTLAHRLKAEPLPPREAAALVRTLAGAAQHAHERGVVHRDLKPSNVLFAADGAAKLADFGLAKMLGEGSPAQTQTHAVLGTASYMAPEQAAGRGKDATPAMDVWALGAILYECLTGQPAFRGRDWKATLELVQNADPRRPESLRPGLHLDLEAVCLKCLEKDPRRRYASAAALADDLESWLQGRATQARPLGPVARLLRAARRHPWRTAAVVAALLALVLLPAALYYRDPDRPLTALESRLERGESVSLIPSPAGPAWSDLVLGKEAAVLTPGQRAPLEEFSFSSVAESYLELARNPRQERYRLRAQVRHWRGIHGGKVGVYFLRGSVPVPEGTAHWFYYLAFNDQVSDVENFKNNILPNLPPGARPPPIPAGNPVLLGACLFGEVAGRLRVDFCPPRHGRLTFTPPRLQTEVGWRELVVDVRPEGFTANWDGKLVAEVGAADLERDARALQDQLGTLTSGGPRVEFSLRGSLGLYVSNGSAYYRDVVIEPSGGTN